MPRHLNKLGALAVRRLSKPGRHSDGGGLYLVIDRSGARRWVFLYRRRRDSKLCEMGLGGVIAVPLTRARQKAAAARALLAEGQDPLVIRRARQHVPSFGEVADDVVTTLEAGWRNEKHRQQWKMTLNVYAASLRPMAVNHVDTAHVLAVLTALWQSKPETASRVRGRIEKVLDAARAKGLRVGENPARWRGHLDHLLPKRQTLTRGHHAAMPWIEIPTFMDRLRANSSVAAMALEFVILTAARSGEVLRSVRDGHLMAARWDEIDAASRLWTIPPVRMKAGRSHRVPLSGRAIEILREIAKARRDEFIFPGARKGAPLSAMALEMLMRRLKAKPYTVHGFRSTFRDWAGECTNVPREVAEAALAHTVGDKVERAYRRADALEKRRELMEAWAEFCGSSPG